MVGVFMGGGKHNQISLYEKKLLIRKEKKAEFQIPRESYLFAFPVTNDRTAAFSGRKS